MMKRITVYIGNFGSGKTELAINTALRLRKEGKQTRLVDVDVINPYFKSSFRRAVLEDAGVRVVGPNDLGTLPPEVISAFDDNEAYAVMDAGGDPAGAVVLGRYKDRFEDAASELDILYVVNACRPMSDTPERVLGMMDEIERSARLRIGGLINNTNLAGKTTADDLVSGQEMVMEVGRRRGLPVRFVSGKPEVLKGFRDRCGRFEGELFPIEIYMREEWMETQ